MSIACKTLQKWSDIHRYQRPGWIYRGQKRKSWPLRTSLERCYKTWGIKGEKKRNNLEKELIREFQRAYYQYAQHIPDEKSHIEWLSLMQHHGAPTRLLDFTYSIYIAAYFALESAEKDECAVWAVNGRWLSKQTQNIFRCVGNPSATRLMEPTQKFHEQDYHDMLNAEPPVKAAFFLNPFRLNQRLRVQHATFIAPCTVSDRFMDNLRALDGYNKRENCIKIVIPNKFRKNALSRLFDMNISRTSLFPGLDGYTQSLCVFHPSFRRDVFASCR